MSLEHKSVLIKNKNGIFIKVCMFPQAFEILWQSQIYRF